jgi:hypothetical protein
MFDTPWLARREFIPQREKKAPGRNAKGLGEVVGQDY